MPIFKVTVKEEITRRVVAYVEAADSDAADTWASNAPADCFRQEGEEYIWSKVDQIDQTDTVPERTEVHMPAAA